MRTLDALVRELPRASRTIHEGADPEAMTELARAFFIFSQEQGRVELLQTGQLVDAAPIFAALTAVAEWQLGAVAAAADHARRAVGGTSNVLDSTLALLSLAQVSQLQGDHERAVVLGREMSALGQRGDDPLLATMAHVVQALSYAALGRTGEAVREARSSAQVAQASGSVLAAAWAAYAQGEVRLEEVPGEALGHLDRARALGRTAGSRLVVGVAGLSWVSLRARSATDDESLAEFAEIIEHWSRAGTATHQWATVRNLVQVLAQRGADDDAARLHGALMAAPRRAGPHGAEAARLAAAMKHVEGRLGPLRFSELMAEGARWSDIEVVTQSRLACRPISAVE